MPVTKPARRENSFVENRRDKRLNVLRRCRIRPAGKANTEGWRSVVFDYSPGGLGITLPAPVQKGAILEVIPDQTDAPALRVRVVHVRPLAHIWLCGCALEAPISDPTVQKWLDGTPP
jgi:hypothetical protein